MARRRIGQEALGLPGVAQAGSGSALDQLATPIDWAPVEARLKDTYAAAKGEPAWPPLALFKALLIAVWHDLSDVRWPRRWTTGPRSDACVASRLPEMAGEICADSGFRGSRFASAVRSRGWHSPGREARRDLMSLYRARALCLLYFLQP